jgi:hypothetical protein
MVLSGTLLLPFPTYPSSADDCRKSAQRLRDLRYNPERHLGPGAETDPVTAELLAQKQAWIAHDPQDHDGKRRRWRTLRLLKEELQPAVEDQRREMAEQLIRCSKELKANAVLRRRDYAFCLHPEAELRSFLTRFLETDPGKQGR